MTLLVWPESRMVTSAICAPRLRHSLPQDIQSATPLVVNLSKILLWIKVVFSLLYFATFFLMLFSFCAVAVFIINVMKHAALACTLFNTSIFFLTSHDCHAIPFLFFHLYCVRWFLHSHIALIPGKNKTKKQQGSLSCYNGIFSRKNVLVLRYYQILRKSRSSFMFSRDCELQFLKWSL